jgi:hypothetical protein
MISRNLLVVFFAVISTNCSFLKNTHDPYGARDLAEIAIDIREENAEKETLKLEADMRASLCATPNGRRAIAKEAARSDSDDIEPCLTSEID